MDYKTKLDKLIMEDNNNKKIIINLKNEIYTKERERQISNYNSPPKSNNNNVTIIYDSKSKSNQEKQNYLRNIETIKETHIKEINKYKEILKQKETEIIRMKNENSIRSKSSNKPNTNPNDIIYELQKIINDLKKEINQLYLKLKDYDSLKKEIELIYKRGGNNAYKEIDRTTLKLAYDALIQENKQLKEKISKIQKNKY